MCSGFYLGIYTVLGFSQAVAIVFASAFLVISSMIGAKTLHNNMLSNIIRSPMSFFDITPTGRILNRFSKDIYTIDETIPRSVFMFFGSTFTVLSVIVVIAVATPVFISVIIPLAVMYALIQVSAIYYSIVKATIHDATCIYIWASIHVACNTQLIRRPLYSLLMVLIIVDNCTSIIE